jgi:Lhr-like helicase
MRPLLTVGFRERRAKPRHLNTDTVARVSARVPGPRVRKTSTSLDSSELSMRRFRAIARVSGRVFREHPAQQKSARQLQASRDLFHEIFRNHDSGNPLLDQADAEVLLQELDARRIRTARKRMNASRVVITRPKKPTPFARSSIRRCVVVRVSDLLLSARLL